MAIAAAIDETILPALTQRLETALELVTTADAMARLGEVAVLCREAETLAAAGRLLLTPDDA